MTVSSVGNEAVQPTSAGHRTDGAHPSGREQVLAALREHVPLFLLIAGFLAACGAARLLTGHAGLDPINRLTIEFWISQTLVGLALPLAYHLVHFHARFFIDWKKDPDGHQGTIASRFLSYQRKEITLFRVTGALLVSALMAILYTTFWAFKRTIPLFNPFSWDPAFSRLDEALHLGQAPWKLLQPAFGNPAMTIVLDRLYFLWIVLVLGIVAWQAWRADRQARMHFLLAYCLSWMIVGTLMAIVLSSAGPCYFGRLFEGPDSYAPLMTFLYDVDAATPLLALRLQEWLWDGYVGLGYFQGISAMPSMHLTVLVLFVLGSLKAGRWIAAMLALYTVAIMLGSVHLGWHYAVDGYVGIIVAVAIWLVARRWSRSLFSTRSTGFA